MKRFLGGALFVFLVISLAASVCLADIAGPRWPPVVTATSINK